MNLEAAGRAFEGGCGAERLDLTVGYRPDDGWMALGQVFLDRPREGSETVKAQLSLVRFEDEGRGIQIGIRARISDGPAEPALVIGFWGRPGR